MQISTMSPVVRFGARTPKVDPDTLAKRLGEALEKRSDRFQVLAMETAPGSGQYDLCVTVTNPPGKQEDPVQVFTRAVAGKPIKGLVKKADGTFSYDGLPVRLYTNMPPEKF